MTNNKIPEEAIIAMAKWWREALRAPEFDTGLGHRAKQATFLATMAAPVLTAEDLDRFEKVFIREVQKKYSAYFCIETDYAPQYLLAKIAKEANISGMAFPWKSETSWIDGKVIARCGYNGVDEIIWEQK